MLEHEKEIQEMRRQGKTRKEIADELGLQKRQIENFINRHNRRQRMDAIPNRRGRPRKNPLLTQQDYEQRIKELERDNELLRSFLRAAGRM